MVLTSFLSYVLLHLLHFSEGTFLDFFRHLDVRLLDDTDFCEVVTNLPHFHDDDWFADLPLFVSFHDQTCQPALIIKSLRIESLADESCNQRTNYIKDPNVTYLFVNDEHHNLEKYFDEYLFAKLPCIMEKQPYFFVMTTIENILTINEIQVFSKSIQFVAKYERTEIGWKLRESMPDTFQRRSNFFGNEIIAHYDDREKYGIIDDDGSFIGYNGDIGTLLQETFNFSLVLHPINGSYGVKKGLNEYTGTVNELYKNNIDIGMATFNQIPERLEVTDGGFSPILGISELIFWHQDQDQFIYAMVFDNMIWITILIMLVLSSSIYFFFHIDNKCMETILEATALSMKALLVLGIEQFSLRKTIMTRTFLLTISLSGALLYWSYTGSLVSYFTIESAEKPPITSFEDILKYPKMKLLMNRGSADSQYIINAINKDPKLNNSIVWYENVTDMYQEFMQEETTQNVVLFKTNFFAQQKLRASYDTNSLCKIRHGLLENIRTKRIIGWLYPKNSLLKRLFDKFIISLNEKGIERKLYLKYFGNFEEDNCERETKAIRFYIVVALFKSLAIGIFIAFIVLIVEIVFMHLRKHKVQIN